MSQNELMREVARDANVSEADAMLVVEAFLTRLHRFEFERDRERVDFVGRVRRMISDRALYHLLGFLDSHAEEGDSWEPGTIVEYLGRMPPVERWEKLYPGRD